ncbi:hypothetical protein NOC27_2339 [Nitrosococcus oceani AFC27]|nr:hypothetical protein NOC27_2339 [Nitrosococcus oceani AFC27]
MPLLIVYTKYHILLFLYAVGQKEVIFFTKEKNHIYLFTAN